MSHKYVQVRDWKLLVSVGLLSRRGHVPLRMFQLKTWIRNFTIFLNCFKKWTGDSTINWRFVIL